MYRYLSNDTSRMNFLAVIPARYASTRFPGKPLADIGGKTMIRRVYERVSVFYPDCCVATDDDRILREVESFGGVAVMTSEEHRSGTDRCAEALSRYEAATGRIFDVVVNVQGDEPFVSKEHLLKIKGLFDSPATQIGTLVKKFSADEDIFNPNTPKVAIGAGGRALYFSRSVIPYMRGKERQEWASGYDYLKHIGIYGYRSDVLREITRLPQGMLEIAESLEQLRWLENGYFIMTALTTESTVAVDTPEDLQKVLESL